MACRRRCLETHALTPHLMPEVRVGDTPSSGDLVTPLGQDGLKAFRIGEGQAFRFFAILHGQEADIPDA
jgi:hypothetical protein